MQGEPSPEQFEKSEEKSGQVGKWARKVGKFYTLWSESESTKSSHRSFTQGMRIMSSNPSNMKALPWQANMNELVGDFEPSASTVYSRREGVEGAGGF